MVGNHTALIAQARLQIEGFGGDIGFGAIQHRNDDRRGPSSCGHQVCDIATESCGAGECDTRTRGGTGGIASQGARGMRSATNVGCKSCGHFFCGGTTARRCVGVAGHDDRFVGGQILEGHGCRFRCRRNQLLNQDAAVGLDRFVQGQRQLEGLGRALTWCCWDCVHQRSI